jgi:hypothetical protein
MDAAWLLQVMGAGLELAGVGLVAKGISETRAQFGRPSITEKVGAAIKRAAARLRRKPQSVTLSVSSSVDALIGGRAYATVTQGQFDDDTTLEERIERLRGMVNQHAESVTRLDKKIDDERGDREEAERSADQRLEERARRIEGLIEDMATGGLRREALGASALVLGVILSTWGNLIG